jgi:hypothetical protein
MSNDEAKQRAKNYMSLKGALEPKIKCDCGHTNYCDCGPLDKAKQTAVDWLVNQVEDYIGLIPVDIIEQAKQMEKEQIMNSWASGVTSDGNMTAEQYYNKKYN